MTYHAVPCMQVAQSNPGRPKHNVATLQTMPKMYSRPGFSLHVQAWSCAVRTESEYVQGLINKVFFMLFVFVFCFLFGRKQQNSSAFLRWPCFFELTAPHVQPRSVHESVSDIIRVDAKTVQSVMPVRNFLYKHSTKCVDVSTSLLLCTFP